MASTVKHLRSSTASKRPTASGLAEGQLAINTASGTPGLFLKDSAGAVVKVGPVHVGASAPNAVPAGSAGNSTGELWVNNSTTIHGLNYYTGSAFVNLTPSGTTTVAGLVELATNAETQTGTDTVRAVTPSGLQSKVSDSTSTTSSTTIASSTAVKAAYDLANAALPKAGGRVTGNLEIGPAGSLSFEGSSDDSFETTLAVVNPTADRTITLPNTTGTVITTGDSGTVTSAMIADLNIVNADINASAAIALSKLATGALPSGITVASANIVDGTIVNADINASAAIADTKLATISTAGKVSNSATTATDANTASTIVARDASGNFAAGDITIGDKIIHAGDTNTAIRFPAADTFAVETAGSEGLRVDSVGNLLVGTTVALAPNTTTDNGFRCSPGGAVTISRSTNFPLALQRTGSVGNVAAFYSDTTAVGTISITASATAYNTSSDYRLKENITLLNGAIVRINQLPVHRFNFIADPDTIVDGFIAHEAAAVVPECVTGEKDEVDEDGDPVYQGIDQSKLVPLLTAALQEAIAEINALKARVAALEA
jgi:hypothetical protein